MADPRFYAAQGPFTLGELARISGARIDGEAPKDAMFTDVAPLESAKREHVSFLDNRKYVDEFAKSEAGACLLHPDLASSAPREMALLLTPEPYHGYARVARAFYPPSPPGALIAPSATVSSTADIAPDSRVEAGAVIGERVMIGRRCQIGANAVVGDAVVIGNDCRIGSSATLAYCLVGDRVIIHAGARIGQDGFGFALGPDGHLKVPQLGRVIIEDDVEIGANTTVDRGSGPDTVIGAGTKIDNLVQIAHNVHLGESCVIVSQVGISGSTRVGDLAMMGGQAGITGHLKIGSGARIAAQSGVMRDVDAGTSVAGSPALPAKEFWRRFATVAKLGRRKNGSEP